MARELNWQQTRVSKLELGAQLPSDEDLDAWVAATGAGPDVRVELGELLTPARIEHRAWAEDYRSGSIAASQAQIGELKAEATVIREYQPSMLPSIVQTVAYAREMLLSPGGPVLVGATPDAVEALIAERVKRQALLYEPRRQVRIVLGEAALTDIPRAGRHHPHHRLNGSRISTTTLVNRPSRPPSRSALRPSAHADRPAAHLSPPSARLAHLSPQQPQGLPSLRSYTVEIAVPTRSYARGVDVGGAGFHHQKSRGVVGGVQ